MKIKLILTTLLIGMIMSITACSDTVSINSGSLNESTIALNQDGKIEMGIVWDFSKEYYDTEEFEAFTNDEINKFKAASGENTVNLEYMKKIDDKMHVTMTFDSVRSYAEFNQEEAEFMKLSEAAEQGLIPDVVENSDKSGVTETDTLNGDDYYAAVWKGDYQLMVEGEIYFYTNGIILDDNVIKTSSDDVTIVIFK
ncbi:MAG: hypothetical protein LBR68_05605 [Lachnoclostridium sp.]|jgi:hypothetical protein|nr:hypothetical protein [Lachnoclostridium sp.]